jgi:hypothetical protein
MISKFGVNNNGPEVVYVTIRASQRAHANGLTAFEMVQPDGGVDCRPFGDAIYPD